MAATPNSVSKSMAARLARQKAAVIASRKEAIDKARSEQLNTDLGGTALGRAMARTPSSGPPTSANSMLGNKPGMRRPVSFGRGGGRKPPFRGRSSKKKHHHHDAIYASYLPNMEPRKPEIFKEFVPTTKNYSDEYLWGKVELHPVVSDQFSKTFFVHGMSLQDIPGGRKHMRRHYSRDHAVGVPTVVSTYMPYPTHDIPEYLMDSLYPAAQAKVKQMIKKLNAAEDLVAAKRNLKLFGTDFSNLDTYRVQTKKDLLYEIKHNEELKETLEKQGAMPLKKAKSAPALSKGKSKTPPPKKAKSKPKKAKSKTPPPKKGKSKTPPPKKAKSKTPPPKKTKSKIPKLKKSKSKTPPPKKTKSKIPPSKSTKSRTPTRKTRSKSRSRLPKGASFPSSSRTRRTRPTSSKRPLTPRHVMSSMKRAPTSRPTSAKINVGSRNSYTYTASSDLPTMPVSPKFPRTVVLPPLSKSRRRSRRRPHHHRRTHKSPEEEEEGLCFEFRPVSPCAAEISITIEPPDDECPLEYAVNNGIMPIVCCMMPPCYTIPPNGRSYGHQYPVYCPRPNYC